VGLGFFLWAGGRPEYKNSMSDKNNEPPVPSFVGPQNLRVSQRGSQGALTGMATCECHQEQSPGHFGRSTTGEALAIWPSLQARPGMVSLTATVPLGLSSKNQAHKAGNEHRHMLVQLLRSHLRNLHLVSRSW